MNAPRPLSPDYTPHARAERLIAAGRFLLAFSSLTAVYFEPSTPAKYQHATYSLLVIYTAYALALCVVAWRLALPSRRWRLVSHVLDLVLFSVFIYLTEGPASPFFIYFVFSLFCATLRFSWRGILSTGGAAIVAYAVVALVTINDPTFEVTRVLIREVYLGVIAALLVYLGMYQERLRAELALLAAWPRELAPQFSSLLSTTLAHAALVLHAGTLRLAWEEGEEPWIYTATLAGRELTLGRIPPAETDAFALGPELRNTSFFLRSEEPLLVYDATRSTVVEHRGVAVPHVLRQLAGDAPALVVSVATENVSACMAVPGVASVTADELALAHVAGRLLLATFEQYFFLQQVRQTASAEERMRISRELHDGIVQSLGGVGLQLQAIGAQVDDHSEAKARLRRVQNVIEHDQRELRAIVRELGPQTVRDGRLLLNDELQRMRERFPLEWGLEVALEVSTPDEVPARVAHEICRIVNESLSNAARHGNASRADVAVHARAGGVDVSIRDNGRGFPFTGRHDLAALELYGHGPRTLKERIRTLHGRLTVESSGAGALIEAWLPAAGEARG